MKIIKIKPNPSCGKEETARIVVVALEERLEPAKSNVIPQNHNHRHTAGGYDFEEIKTLVGDYTM